MRVSDCSSDVCSSDLIDVKRFFHGETKAGAMMFENGYVHQKLRPAYNRARIECRGRKPFIYYSRFEAVSHPLDFVREDYLKGIDDQIRGIAIHQIPAIRLNLLAHLCRHPSRPIPADPVFPSPFSPP